MSIRDKLKAAGARIDGLTFDASGRRVFKTTRASGAWTQAQIDLVNQVLGVEPPLVSAATKLIGQIDALRDRRLAAGYADTGEGGTGKTWQCDGISQKNWTAIGALAQPWALELTNATPAPSFAPWGMDNEPVTLTAAQAYQLFAVRIATWVQATMDYARAMKAAVRAGNPPTDITQGWP